MTINFNQEEYIKQLEIQKKLEDLKTVNLVDIYESQINEIKKEIDNLKRELKKKNTFIGRLGNPRKISRLRRELESKQEALVEKEKEHDNFVQKANETKEEIARLESEKKEIFISDAVSYDDKGLIISDKIRIVPGEKHTDNKVMVHSTDFFPKNKTISCAYDGNRRHTKDISLNGENKQVDFLDHRHTVHFTINSVVVKTGMTEVAGGKWDQPKFIIIEPLDNHREQFISDLVSNSDEYTYGSVKLGEKPILLVREDSYNDIPKEEIPNYNIIRYSGNYITCVNNLLLMLGYKLTYGDANNPSHAHSYAKLAENLLNERNIVINYALDNVYDGKADMDFSMEQLNKIYNSYQSVDVHERFFDIYFDISDFYHDVSEKINVPEEFVRFCIDYRFYKDGDKYKMENDDRTYNMIKTYNKLYEKIKNKYKNSGVDLNKAFIDETDFSYIKDIYIDYLKNQKNQIINNEIINKQEEISSGIQL